MKSQRILALVMVSVSALASTACMVGEGESSTATEPTDEDLPPLLSEAALSNNARTAFNFFAAKGFSDVQAAGIVGNLMQESSVSPTAVEYGGGPGRGIAQWSLGGRWNSGTSVVSFAASRGANRWALQTQLDFIWFELNNNAAYGLSQLRATTTIESAVTVFQNKYEICGTCSQTKRLQYARQALADYGGSTTGTGGDTTGTGGGSGSGGTDTGGDVPAETCYSGTLQREMPENACVESTFDGLWYQCAYGQWVDRWSDPDPCNGEYPL
jgi:hypothetical protein